MCVFLLTLIVICCIFRKVTDSITARLLLVLIKNRYLVTFYKYINLTRKNMKLHVPSLLRKALLAAIFTVPALTYDASAATDAGVIDSTSLKTWVDSDANDNEKGISIDYIQADGVQVTASFGDITIGSSAWDKSINGNSNQVKADGYAISATGDIVGDSNKIEAVSLAASGSSLQGDGNTIDTENDIHIANISGSSNELSSKSGNITLNNVTAASSDNIIKADQTLTLGDNIDGESNVFTANAITGTGTQVGGDSNEFNATGKLVLGDISGSFNELRSSDSSVEIESIFNKGDSNTITAETTLTVKGKIEGSENTLTSKGDLTVTDGLGGVNNHLKSNEGNVNIGSILNTALDSDVYATLNLTVGAVSGERSNLVSEQKLTAAMINGDGNALTSKKADVEIKGIGNEATANEITAATTLTVSGEIEGSGNFLTGATIAAGANALSGDSNELDATGSITLGEVSGNNNELATTGVGTIATGVISGMQNSLTSVDGNITIAGIALTGTANTITATNATITLNGEMAGSGNFLTGTTIAAGANTLSGDSNELNATGSITLGEVSGNNNELATTGDGTIVTGVISGMQNSLKSENGDITIAGIALTGTANTITATNATITLTGHIEGQGNILSAAIIGGENSNITAHDNTLIATDTLTVKNINSNDNTLTSTNALVTGNISGADNMIQSEEGSVTIEAIYTRADGNKITAATTLTLNGGLGGSDNILTAGADIVTQNIAGSQNELNAGTTITVVDLLGNENELAADGNITANSVAGNLNSLTTKNGSVAIQDLDGATDLTIAAKKGNVELATGTVENVDLDAASLQVTEDVTFTGGDITLTGAGVNFTADTDSLLTLIDTNVQLGAGDAHLYIVDISAGLFEANELTAHVVTLSEGAGIDAIVLTDGLTATSGVNIVKGLTTDSLSVSSDASLKILENIEVSDFFHIEGDVSSENGDVTLTDSSADMYASFIDANVSTEKSIVLGGDIVMENSLEDGTYRVLNAGDSIQVAQDAKVLLSDSKLSADDGIKIDGALLVNKNVALDGVLSSENGSILKRGGDTLSLMAGSDFSTGQIVVEDASTLDAADGVHIGSTTLREGTQLVVANSSSSTGRIYAENLTIEAPSGISELAKPAALIHDVDLATKEIDVIEANSINFNGGKFELVAHNKLAESSIADDTRMVVATGVILDGNEASEFVNHDLITLNVHAYTLDDEVTGEQRVELAFSKNYIGAGKTSNQTAVSSALLGVNTIEVEGSTLGDVLTALGETRSEADALAALDFLGGMDLANLNRVVIDSSSAHMLALRSSALTMAQGLDWGTDKLDAKRSAVASIITGGGSDLDADGNASGYSSSHIGFMVIGAHKVMDNWTTGFSFAYSRNSAISGSSDIQSNTFFLDASVIYEAKRATHVLTFGAGFYDISTDRQVSVSADQYSVTGHAEGSTSATLVNIGYEFDYSFMNRGSAQGVSALFQLDASFGTIDAFTEKGFDNAGLEVEPESIASLTAAAGMRYRYEYMLNGNAGFVTAEALMTANTGNAEVGINNRFIGGGNAFSQLSPASSAIGLRLNVNGVVPITTDWSAFAGVNAEFRTDQNSVNTSIGVKYSF